jgi:lactoylglutathione lyase
LVSVIPRSTRPAIQRNRPALDALGETLVNLLSSTAGFELLAPAGPGDPGAGPRFVLTIDVVDVDAVAADLVERGAVLLNGTIDRPWGIRTASFRDPAGHVWEIATSA